MKLFICQILIEVCLDVTDFIHHQLILFRYLKINILKIKVNL